MILDVAHLTKDTQPWKTLGAVRSCKVCQVSSDLPSGSMKPFPTDTDKDKSYVGYQLKESGCNVSVRWPLIRPREGKARAHPVNSCQFVSPRASIQKAGTVSMTGHQHLVYMKPYDPLQQGTIIVEGA